MLVEYRRFAAVADELIRSRPASASDRWLAQLYFLKPLVFGVLALESEPVDPRL